METTRLSTKGQIILPKSVRDSHEWTAGTEFTVEETAAGILLKPVSPFPRTTVEQVAGCLKPRRRVSRTLGPAEIQAAVDKEIAKRHARGRY